jgi:hypothetical protein
MGIVNIKKVIFGLTTENKLQWLVYGKLFVSRMGILEMIWIRIHNSNSNNMMRMVITVIMNNIHHQRPLDDVKISINHHARTEEVYPHIAEFDLLSKCNALKGRFMQLNDKFNACKIQSVTDIDKGKEIEAWLVEEVNRQETLSEVKSRLGDKTKDRKKVRMSFQHDISK